MAGLSPSFLPHTSRCSLVPAGLFSFSSGPPLHVAAQPQFPASFHQDAMVVFGPRSQQPACCCYFDKFIIHSSAALLAKRPHFPVSPHRSGTRNRCHCQTMGFTADADFLWPPPPPFRRTRFIHWASEINKSHWLQLTFRTTPELSVAQCRHPTGPAHASTRQKFPFTNIMSVTIKKMQHVRPAHQLSLFCSFTNAGRARVREREEQEKEAAALQGPFFQRLAGVG